jgi:osmotically-inducible protein OsmY
MLRHRIGFLSASIIGALLWAGTPATGQEAQSRAKAAPALQTTRADAALLQALATNPVTAPYRFSTSARNGKLALSARVGTKAVHDAAIQTAIALGYTVDDQIVIDTAEVYRAAATAPAQPGPGPVAPVGSGLLGSSLGLGFGGAMGTIPYVYPPPLFGYYDDPFYGFDPPAISYPPWWGALTARRVEPAQAGPTVAAGPPGANAAAPNAATPSANPNPSTSQSVTTDGAVEMTIDQTGVATLRGTVPTLADRIAVGQRLAQTPGVSQVINLLNTRESSATPPPPPTPEIPGQAGSGVPIQVAPPAAPVHPKPGMAINGNELTKRLEHALARRESLAKLPIHVASRDGVATISGKVPSALKAMQIFRAVQQTPGVRAVQDFLEFSVPDENGKNPLIEQGRPDDLEPYLEAQIRRQLGDAAHIDKVRVQGDMLTIRGTIPSGEDKARLAAILHSMPVLRGYRLETELVAE